MNKMGARRILLRKTISRPSPNQDDLWDFKQYLSSEKILRTQRGDDGKLHYIYSSETYEESEKYIYRCCANSVIGFLEGNSACLPTWNSVRVFVQGWALYRSMSNQTLDQWCRDAYIFMADGVLQGKNALSLALTAEDEAHVVDALGEIIEKEFPGDPDNEEFAFDFYNRMYDLILPHRNILDDKFYGNVSAELKNIAETFR